MAYNYQNPKKSSSDDDHFGVTEPGLINTISGNFIRLRNDGRIELSAGNGVAIVLDPHHRTIAFVSDKVKFFTQDNGLRWNDFSFNPQAHRFGQPTLVPTPEVSDYDGIEDYLD